jgi:hypothetical protein
MVQLYVFLTNITDPIYVQYLRDVARWWPVSPSDPPRSGLTLSTLECHLLSVKTWSI